MTDMTVDSLVESLSQLEKAAGGPANRNPRLGIKNAIKFLEKYRGKRVDQLASELRASKPKQRSAQSQQMASPTVVNLHVGALKRAGTSKTAFSEALQRLKADSSARLIELKQIVHEYAGDRSSFRSKTVGYGIIDQAFDDRWKLDNR